MLAKPYNTPNSWGPTYEAHKRYLEFDEQQMKELMDYADSVGIALMATPMDIVSHLEKNKHGTTVNNQKL
jgi:sialic acid synthase